MEIFNSYKQKLPAFNNYVSSYSYKGLLTKLDKAFSSIKEKISNVRIKMDDKLFLIRLKIVITKCAPKQIYSDIRKQFF